MRRWVMILGLLGTLGAAGTMPGEAMKQFTWTLDNLTAIGGHKVAVEGKPKLVDAEGPKAVEFNGQEDALVLEVDPVQGAAAFTIEAVFRPDAGGAREQRFVHMQENGSENRVMLETRLTEDGRWYADTYIRSGKADSALNDPKLLHPLGQWHSLALVYDGRQMTQYVNGQRELSRRIVAAPHGAGRMSIGMRLNRVCHFKGAIRMIRITHGALKAEELVRP